MRIKNLHHILINAERNNKLPSVTGYHRIDGPGSSLALPLFQRYFWKNVKIPIELDDDPTWSWSRGFPRTVGITINTGTKVTAYPYTCERLAMESKDYEDLTLVEEKIGNITPTRRNWILKIMEIIEDYRDIRTGLCSEYMNNFLWLYEIAQTLNCVIMDKGHSIVDLGDFL